MDPSTAHMIRQVMSAQKVNALYGQHLHPEQARLTTGDAAIVAAPVFHPNPDARWLGWLLVIDAPRMADVARAVGRPEDATTGQKGLGQMVADHILPGTLDITGGQHCPVAVHAFACWPISHEVYAAGMDAQWEPELMAPEYRAHLEVALIGFEGHMKALREQGVAVL